MLCIASISSLFWLYLHDSNVALLRYLKATLKPRFFLLKPYFTGKWLN